MTICFSSICPPSYAPPPYTYFTCACPQYARSQYAPPPYVPAPYGPQPYDPTKSILNDILFVGPTKTSHKLPAARADHTFQIPFVKKECANFNKERPIVNFRLIYAQKRG